MQAELQTCKHNQLMGVLELISKAAERKLSTAE